MSLRQGLHLGLPLGLHLHLPQPSSPTTTSTLLQQANSSIASFHSLPITQLQPILIAPRPLLSPTILTTTSTVQQPADAGATAEQPSAPRPRGPPRERRGKYRCKTCGGLGHTQKTCGRARPITPPAGDGLPPPDHTDPVDPNNPSSSPRTPPRIARSSSAIIAANTVPSFTAAQLDRLSPARLEAALEAAKRRVFASIVSVAECTTDESLHAAADVFEANTAAFERVAHCVFRCVAVENGLDRIGGLPGRGMKRNRDDATGEEVLDVVVENGAKDDDQTDDRADDSRIRNGVMPFQRFRVES